MTPLDPGKGNGEMTLVTSARWFVLAAVLCAVSAIASITRADEPSAGSTTAAAAAPADKVEPGDNAWMLISSALVLMMTGPGLALFYCGLVRKKNVLSVMMQCIFLMCLMTVIWATYGFALSFGNDPRCGKRINRPPTARGSAILATSSTISS